MASPANIALANRLADAAGAAIRPFFRTEFTHESKGDASPVTEADRAAEAAIRAILDVECPNDAIVGEEYGTKDGTSGRLGCSIRLTARSASWRDGRYSAR